MKVVILVLAALFAMASAYGPIHAPAAMPSLDEIGERLRNRIEAAADMAETPELTAYGDLVY